MINKSLLFLKYFCNTSIVNLQAIKEDSSIRAIFEEELAKMVSVARYSLRPFVYGDSWVSVSCRTMNWKLALGGHNIFLVGKIEGRYLKYELYALDRYNFTPGDHFGPFRHDQFVRFVSAGVAHYFTSIGYVYGEVWLG